MRAAVAGAGIAGLTSAIALAGQGIEVAVFERAPQLQEAGAGIQLSPNAMRVLERLGILPELDGKLSEPSAIEIGSAPSGRLLTRIPLGATARGRFGAPYCLIHRANLQAGLLRAARSHASISLHLQAEVHDLRATEAGVVFSAAGTARLTDILVVADGVHSRLRTAHFGHPGAQASGRTAWRATLPRDVVPGWVKQDVTGLWMGPGAHLVHYPVASGAELNVVVVGSSDSDAVRPPRAPFGPQLIELMDAAPAWTAWPILRMDASKRWTAGRVVLVGDAAHAMVPAAAQGGAQSIEDAWVLARNLAAHPASPAHALAEYERIRRPRVSRVVRQGERNLRIYNMGGPLAAARNVVLSVLPGHVHLARLDWLFSFAGNGIA